MNPFNLGYATCDENASFKTATSLGLLRIHDSRCRVCVYVLVIE